MTIPVPLETGHSGINQRESGVLRIHLRKNKRDDPQIIEALACADKMEADRVAAQGEQHD